MTLVNAIRDYEKNHSIEEAVDLAVDKCIQDGVLADILRVHKAEVKDMVLTEFNKEVYENGIREEGAEEGVDRVFSVLDLIKKGETIEDIVNKGYPIGLVKRAEKYLR